MGYVAWSVVFGEQPSAAKWNILGANDASFNDGTGIANLSLASTALSNPYKFRVYRSGNQSISTGVNVKVQFNAETFDTNNNFDSSTNYRYVAPIDGYYRIDGAVGNNGIGFCIPFIYKSGSQIAQGSRVYGSAGSSASVVSNLVQLNASQYVELFVYSDNNTVLGGSDITYFEGHLVSKT